MQEHNNIYKNNPNRFIQTKEGPVEQTPSPEALSKLSKISINENPSTPDVD